MEFIIPRNSTIPTKKSHIIFNEIDNQQKILIKIFEGERQMTKDNNLIGEIQFDNISSTPDGKLEIEVTFDLDANSVLNVKAELKATKMIKQMTIKRIENLTPEEIKNFIKEKENYSKKEETKIDLIESKNNLVQCCSNCNDYLSDQLLKEKNNESLGMNEKKKIIIMKNEINEILASINSKTSELTKYFEETLKNLQSKFESLKFQIQANAKGLNSENQTDISGGNYSEFIGNNINESKKVTPEKSKK